MTILINCTISSPTETAVFYEMFNGLMNEEDVSPPGNEIQFYCIKSYISGKQLRSYTFDLNPRKIDVLGANCPMVIATARSDAASIFASDPSLNKKQKVCVKEKFLANGEYFDSIALAISLGHAKDMSMSQVKEERERFIKIMSEMTNDLNQCVMKKKKEKKDEKKKE